MTTLNSESIFANDLTNNRSVKEDSKGFSFGGNQLGLRDTDQVLAYDTKSDPSSSHDEIADERLDCNPDETQMSPHLGQDVISHYFALSPPKIKYDEDEELQLTYELGLIEQPATTARVSINSNL